MRALTFVLCLFPALLWADAEMNRAGEQARAFYTRSDAERFKALFRMFVPNAKIHLVYEFGSYYPKSEYKFKLKYPEELSGWKNSEDMKGYTETRKSLKIGEPERVKNGIQVTVEIAGEYKWQGAKGKYKTTDTFVFQSGKGPLKISQYSSVSSI